jgi:hypothetical protein
MTASDSEPLPRETASASLSLLGWGGGLFFSAIVAWACLNFVPPFFTLPERLTEGTVANSATLQAEAAALSVTNDRNNAIISLAMAGVAFGVIPIIFCANGGMGKFLIGFPAGLVVGGVCGLTAALAAFAVRDFLGIGEPDLADEEPSMYADVAIVAVQSAFVVLPAGLVFLVCRVAQWGQKMITVPLAGLVAGLLLPVVGSFLFPGVNNDAVPPKNLWFTLTWLLILATLVYLMTSVASKKPVTVVTDP